MATESTSTPAVQSKRKGKRHGVATELSLFFDVKPGREAQLREAVQTFVDNPGRSGPEELRKIGVHDLRHVMYDNDRRIMVSTTFDGDWDEYFDDGLTLLGPEAWSSFMQHLVDVPDTGLDGMSFTEIKDIIDAHQVTGVTHLRTYPNATVGNVLDALRVYEAFQQVLNHPDAAQALEHPAMQPLLTEAAV